MAGDLPISERALFDDAPGMAAAAPAAGGAVIHRYGRVSIVAADLAAGRGAAGPEATVPGQRSTALGPEDLSRDDLTDVERLGLAALDLRSSPDYRTAKDARPRNGEEWDMPDCTTVVPIPPQARAGAAAAAPTSAYLEGSVAVGIVVVQGPGALAFTPAEQTKVVAEVQNGLAGSPP